MADLSIAIEILGKDSFSPVAKGITGTLGSLFDGAAKLGMGVFGITQLAQGIGSVASGMISGNVQMETYQTQLETLMGSADAAKDRIAQLAQIGADTPFDLPQLVNSEKILMGFGLTSEKTMKLSGKSLDQFRTSLGDMAAGTGTDLGELTNLWGKFSSGATGEAISRLQELGIVTREQLTEVGVQFSKSGELTSPLPQAMEAAVKIADQKFGGGMKKLSQTFAGQMSTLSDTFGQAKVALMAPIFDVLKDSLTSVNAFLSSGTFQEALKSVAALMAGGVKSAIDGLTAGFAALQPWLVRAQDAWGTLVQVFAGDWSPSDDIDPLVNMLGQFATVLRDQVIPPVMQFAGFLQDNWQPVLAAVGVLVAGPILAGIGGLAVGIGAAGLAFVAAAAPIALLAGSFILLKNAWDSNVGDVQNKAAQLSDLFTEDFGALAEIVQQALGGDTAGAFENFRALLDVFTSDLGEILSGWGAEFLAWLEPIVSPLLAQAQDLAGQLIGWVVEQAPVLLAQLLTWGQQFVDWIAPQIPPLLTQLQVLGTQALTWIQQQAAPILESLTAWGIQFVEWVQPQIPPLLAQLGALGLQLIGWVRAQLPTIMATLTEWATQFMAWIGPAIPPMLTALAGLAGDLWAWIRANAPELTRTLASWVTEMIAWVPVAAIALLPELIKFGAALGDWIVNTAAPEVLGFALDIGKALVQGIGDGLISFWGDLTALIGQKMGELLQSAKTAAGIQSPSRLFADQIGRPIGLGIAQGITSTGGAINDAMYIIINEAIKNGIDPIIALALAKAESGFNPKASNTAGEDSHGLFQLNRAGGQGTGFSVAQLEDPQFNASKFLAAHAALFQQLKAEGLVGEQLAATYGRLAEGSDPAAAHRYAEAYRELSVQLANQTFTANGVALSHQQLGAVEQQGITWAQEMARQQEVLTGTLNGQAPAGRAAGDAMTALGAALGPVERRVAEGSMNLGQLEFKLIDLARATGLASAPWDRFAAGTIDADAAMEEVIRSSAGISPAFASVATYLDTAGSSSREAALRFLQLALNFDTGSKTAAAAGTLVGTTTTAMANSVKNALAPLPANAVAAGCDTAHSVAKGLDTCGPTTVTSAKMIAGAMVKAITPPSADVAAVAVNMVGQLSSGLIQETKVATKAATSLADAVMGRLDPLTALANALGGDIPAEMASGIRDATKEAVKAAERMVKEVSDALGGAGSDILNNLPGFASGGVTPGGLIRVGEAGSELLAPPPGWRIYPHGQSPSMAGGGGGGDTIIFEAGSIVIPGFMGTVQQAADAIESVFTRKKGSNGKLGFER